MKRDRTARFGIRALEARIGGERRLQRLESAARDDTERRARARGFRELSRCARPRRPRASPIRARIRAEPGTPSISTSSGDLRHRGVRERIAREHIGRAVCTPSSSEPLQHSLTPGTGEHPAPRAAIRHRIAVADDDGVGAAAARAAASAASPGMSPAAGRPSALGPHHTDRLAAPVRGGIERAFDLAARLESTGGGATREHDHQQRPLGRARHCAPRR